MAKQLQGQEAGPGNLHRFASETGDMFLLSYSVLSRQAEDLKKIWKPKSNWEKKLKRSGGVGHFVNCAGLTPLCF